MPPTKGAKITPTICASKKMRNHLSNEVLDRDMLYLMKAVQATLKDGSCLDGVITILKKSTVLVKFSPT